MRIELAAAQRTAGGERTDALTAFRADVRAEVLHR
jgi:hypothetical protein